MSDPKKFHKSPSQIIRSVYDESKNVIRVDDLEQFEKDNILDQTCILANILTELKVMNLHLSILTDDDISKEDL